MSRSQADERPPEQAVTSVCGAGLSCQTLSGCRCPRGITAPEIVGIRTLNLSGIGLRLELEIRT